MTFPSASPAKAGSSPQNLSLDQYLAYVAPVMMVFFLISPIGLLQGIYAKYFGVSLATIATVLLISRLFDAVTDPLIGYWSDRHQAKAGTRKPFIVVGGLLFIISSYFLYVPVDPNTVDASTAVSPVYFLVWFLLFYLAFTLFEIPHTAWAAELSPGSEAKSKIFSFRYCSSLLGMLCFYLVPFLPIFPSSEFTPHTLQWAVLIAGVVMFFFLFACVLRTPNGPRVTAHRPLTDDTVWALGREVMGSKPLLLFFTAFFLFAGGSSMFAGLLYLLVDIYLKLGHLYAPMVLIGLVASILILGVWYWLANRVGKKFVLGASAFLYAIAAIVTGFLEPEQADLVTLSLVMILVYISALGAIGPALLSEIIDYSTWKSGVDRSATYFALFTFAAKTATAVGTSLGLLIAGGYGFDPAASEQTTQAVFGLHLAGCWLPALLMLSSIVVFGMIPMNVHRHRIIRRRLEARRLKAPKTPRLPLEKTAPAQSRELFAKT